MNKLVSKIWVLMAFAFVVTLTTGCGDDDDKTTDYAKSIQGSYKGTVSLNEQTPLASDVIIKMNYKSVNVVTLQLNQTVVEIPLNVTADCPVTADGSKYKITGTTTADLSTIGITTPVPVNLAGTIDGAKAQINITLADNPLGGGGSLTVIFDGTKQ